jgi:hypothetical protein
VSIVPFVQYVMDVLAYDEYDAYDDHGFSGAKNTGYNKVDASGYAIGLRAAIKF